MSGFTFGIATPQQQQNPAPLFGAPLASSTPAVGNTTGTVGPSLFGSNPTSTVGTAFSFSSPATSQPQSGFNIGGNTTGTAAPSLFGSNPTNPVGSAFSFSSPATSQPQPQTGFNLGGLGAPTTTSTASGFNFGTLGAAAPAASSFASTMQPTATAPSGVPSAVGLGGIPSSAGPRISTLALGNDPGTGWSTRNDNRAVQDLPVPPEIIAAVEELKYDESNHMKNHKATMIEINRAFDLDIDGVAEQIEEVRMGLTTLVNLMHKQELQSAALIKDMQELGKGLLSQARDVPAYGYGGTSALLHNFLYNLLDKYSTRMMKYKVEIERAEFSLQTIVGAYNINAKDLWASLTAIKDTVILLAAQIQQLHEEVRNELNVHKNFSQVLYASAPKPWITRAISGNLPVDQSAPPLERVLSTPSTGAGGAMNLETMYQRTYSMLNRVPSAADQRSLLAQTPEAALRTPAFDSRSPSNFGLSNSYHPSIMGFLPGTTISYRKCITQAFQEVTIVGCSE